MAWSNYSISYPNGGDFKAHVSLDGFLEIGDKGTMIYLKNSTGLDYRLMQQIRYEINRVLDEAIARGSNAS